MNRFPWYANLLKIASIVEWLLKTSLRLVGEYSFYFKMVAGLTPLKNPNAISRFDLDVISIGYSFNAS